MKRLTMGGTDPVLTDDAIAALILEYANELGRVGTTATVTVPAVLDGRPVVASLLLGPASQITVLPHEDGHDEAVVLPGLTEAHDDLRTRIEHLAGRAPASDLGHGPIPPLTDPDIFGE